VQPNVDEERNLCDGERAIEHRDAEVREPDAEQRGDERQHQCFGEELPHHVRSGRAQRSANPDFLGTMRRAVEQ